MSIRINTVTPAVGTSVSSDLADAREKDFAAAAKQTAAIAAALQSAPAPAPSAPRPERQDRLDNIPSFAPPRLRFG